LAITKEIKGSKTDQKKIKRSKHQFLFKQFLRDRNLEYHKENVIPDDDGESTSSYESSFINDDYSDENNDSDISIPKNSVNTSGTKKRKISSSENSN
jgi:hypothetical protein